MTTTSKKPVKKRPVRHDEPVSAKKRSSGKSRKEPVSAKKKSKKKRTKILLFILEIFILLIMVVVLYGVLKVEKVGKVDLPKEEIVINPEVEEQVETTMKIGRAHV